MTFGDLVVLLQNGSMITSMDDGIYGRTYSIEGQEVSKDVVMAAFNSIGMENVKQDRMGGPEKTVLFSIYREDFYEQE